MNHAKGKSQRRFEQLNIIVDKIAPTLRTPTHVAVLLVCFRHGRGRGYFRASTSRVAASVGIKKRQAVNIFDALEKAGVIELVEEHKGPVPRTYKITFRDANGALHCINNSTPHAPG